ncbi:type II toxin-antitoxin system HipA family toxin [Parvibaculaceae bacterium PLY_AMNH_Bact1]|nr:type II toxin-antitoxin system HipA family toxin [Parvibaculaceae bacterium PLY_AMNH_Bact1]
MARKKFSGKMKVALNGRCVGMLGRASSGATSFSYASDWLSWDSAFPISLSLPLQTKKFIGAPVVAVFENLLPDEDIVRRRLAERVGAGGSDAFSLLAKIGRDCVGALQFLPGDEPIPSVGSVDREEISESGIAQILRDLRMNPLGVSTEDDRDFRISIAGAQEKTALLQIDGSWHEPVGATPTTHILKPQIGLLPNGLDMSRSVENEHFCMRLCEALGLETADTEILDFEDMRVLSVRRFDRVWTKDGRLLRLPQEDFCQALSVPPSLKYNSQGGPGFVECLRLLQTSDDPASDQRLFIKAQIVFWAMAATDGHAKNFSIFLQPGGRFTMTPLYDVLSAQPNFDAGELRRRQLKLAMAVGSNRHYPIYEITPRHFAQSAKAAALSSQMVDEVIEEIKLGLDDALERTIASMPEDFPMEMAHGIADGMRNRLAGQTA